MFLLIKNIKNKGSFEKKMNLSNWIKRLEKKRIISRKPHPAILFILSLIILTLGIVGSYLNPDNTYNYIIFFIAGFSFIFSILHLIVVIVVSGKS